MSLPSRITGSTRVVGPARSRLAGPALVLGSVVTVALVGLALLAAHRGFQLDLQVFQDAGRALRSGEPLYDEAFPTRSGLRFIYPPFAALLFGPLAFLPAQPLQVVWSAATVAALWGILALVTHRLSLRRPMLVAFALTGLAIAIEPVRSNLHFGQVNVFLFLLVTADVLGYTPRPVRGLLVGVASGIKIVPAAYGLLFLGRRDLASVARAIAGLALTVVVGALVRPSDSHYFWTTEFFDTARAGTRVFPFNQAVSGVLTRAELPGRVVDVASEGWLVVAALLATWGAHRLVLCGRDVEALLLVLLGICTAAPEAVTHHWSGLVILLPLMLLLRSWWLRVVLGALLLVNFLGTHQAYDLTVGRGLEHWLQWLVGNAQGLLGVVAFCALLVTAARTPRNTR